MLGHVIDQHPHRHGTGVPAARREPPEIGVCGRLVGQVKGLRVELVRKGDHLLPIDTLRSELGG